MGLPLLCRLDFWMVCRCHGILCVHLFFLFRSNIRKDYLGESDFRHCYGHFSESAIPKVTWLQRKFLLNNYINNSILIHAIKIRANSFIKTLVKAMKRKWTKAFWKLSLSKKMRPHTSKNIAGKWMIFHLLLYTFVFLSNKPSF